MSWLDLTNYGAIYDHYEFGTFDSVSRYRKVQNRQKKIETYSGISTFDSITMNCVIRIAAAHCCYRYGAAGIIAGDGGQMCALSPPSCAQMDSV